MNCKIIIHEANFGEYMIKPNYLPLKVIAHYSKEFVDYLKLWKQYFSKIDIIL